MNGPFGSVEGSRNASASISRVGNGYFVNFSAAIQPEPVAIGPDDGLSDDDRLDAMVDAIAAFIGFIHDKGAGEDWKSEDREKVRAGFKAMAPPGLVRSRISHAPVYQEPEQLVFKTKAELIKFIEESF
jgi:hypothetical protein